MEGTPAHVGMPPQPLIVHPALSPPQNRKQGEEFELDEEEEEEEAAAGGAAAAASGEEDDEEVYADGLDEEGEPV